MTSFIERHPEHRPFRQEFDDLVTFMLAQIAGHEVVQLSETVWRCATPGTGNMSFYVARVPGGWLVYGDVGDLFVYRNDDLSWLRGAARSPGYLWEKVPADCRSEHFWPGDALAALDQMVEDAEPGEIETTLARAEEVYETWAAHDGMLESYDAFTDAWYRQTEDPEVPARPRMGHGAVRCVAAARWFCERMPDELPPPPWRSPREGA
jgi:hypothetical protein